MHDKPGGKPEFAPPNNTKKIKKTDETGNKVKENV
jgi:hypothetical protein